VAAVKFKLTIEQGATFRLAIKKLENGVGVNLTGYKAHMQARTVITDALPWFDLSTENGGIEIVTTTVNAVTTSVINVLVLDSVTSALTATSGVYDLILSAPTTLYVDRVIQGSVKLMPGVTR
jgi:hypothetical protein